VSLEDILTELLLRWDEDRALTPEGLCHAYEGHPDYAALLAAVTREIGALRALDHALDTAMGDGTGPPHAAARPATANLPAQVGPYRVEGEIAHGGMGLVARVYDETFNRRLAMKVLLRPAPGVGEQLARNLEERLLREAQVTGLLQHPGIPPVHAQGRLPGDGRPYFIMKLIQGSSLQALLKGRSPTDLELPRFVGIFKQIGQTVGYAHGRGVIHRDLKPSNVMVGAFGEVQVMDWGLAKHLGRGAQGEPPPTESEGTEFGLRQAAATAEATAAGAIWGTLPYMAPEQALGEIDRLDARTDVFGLGAILCEILTGRPPYTGPDVRKKAARADLAEALSRLAGCGADAELVDLARRCLAPRQEDRPADGAAVAEAVAAYQAALEQRTRQAEIDAAAERARASAERRRRRLAVGLAAALLLAVLTGAGSYVLLERQRLARQQQTTLLVTQALEKAKALSDEARAIPRGDLEQQQRAESLWHEALTAARGAEEALASGTADAGTRSDAEALLAALRVESADAGKDRRMLERLEKARELRAQTEEADYVRALNFDRLLDVGFSVGSAAAPAYAAAFREYGIDVAALPAGEAARRIRERPIRDELCAGLDDWYFNDPHAVQGRLLKVSLEADPDPLRRRVRGAIIKEDWQTLKRVAESDEALQLPARTLILLARVLHQKGMRAEALHVMRRGGHKWPGDFWIKTQLGLYLMTTDPPDYSAARACFTAAAGLRPKVASAWVTLGLFLPIEGAQDEALAALEVAARLKPQDTATYYSLSAMLAAKGEPDKALDVIREARRHPDSPVLELARVNVLSQQGKFKEALETYQHVLAQNPKLAGAKAKLAQLLGQTGQRLRARKLLREIEGAHPKPPDLDSIRGQVLWACGDWRGAEAAFRKALRDHPFSPVDTYGLATVLQKQFKYKESLQALRRAALVLPRHAKSRTLLARLLMVNGILEEAEVTARYAVHLDPSSFDAHNCLGTALHMQKKYEEAIAEFRSAIALKPKDASCHFMLVYPLLKLKKVREAIQAGQKAIDLEPRNPGGHIALAGARFANGQVKEAIAEQGLAVRLASFDPQGHYNLGKYLLAGKRYRDAVASFRWAAFMNRQNGLYQTGLASALAEQGLTLLRQKKYKDAEPVLRECLKIRTAKQPGEWATFNAESLLGGSLLGQGKYCDAEPLLLEGYRGLKKHEGKMPPAARPRLAEAVERLVQLYEAQNERGKAAEWRKILEELKKQKK
jgi:serine/threonine protein kinase/tetratricopeptide (TPR) repeat protein